MSLSITPVRTAGTHLELRTPRIAAAAAAAALLVNAAIGLAGDTDDHATGLGLASELTAGLGFLLGAAALGRVVPVTGWRALLWWLAPIGLSIAGATMVGVTAIGSEPAEWLFVVAVLPTFVGLVAVGVMGTSRCWPWWTGAGLALFLPIMFLAPFNGFFMALVWLAAAVTMRSDLAHAEG